MPLLNNFQLSILAGKVNVIFSETKGFLHPDRPHSRKAIALASAKPVRLQGLLVVSGMQRVVSGEGKAIVCAEVGNVSDCKFMKNQEITVTLLMDRSLLSELWFL
jgi:hypothetical protein